MNSRVLSTELQGTLIKVFSTCNSAKIAELRRGVDPAAIYSIRISPDSKILAVTSDKSTLHVFDLPHPGQTDTVEIPQGSKEEASTGKWGILSKIPFLPRAFSDTYSFASAHFETNDGQSSDSETGVKRPIQPIPGIPGSKAPKGIIGWLNDNTLVLVGAGRDGKWEKYMITSGVDGRRYCIRDGWKRYLG
jgi:WD repeat-containing protein 45